MLERKDDADYKYIVKILDPNQFELPRPCQPDSAEDFRAYLLSELQRYATYYETHVRQHTDNAVRYNDDKHESILDKIQRLSEGISEAITNYYQGKLLQATEAFRSALNDVGFNRLTSIGSIKAGQVFYRTRFSNNSRLTKQDLFHPPFERRGNVGTNRYSIPGLPALYLGDSTYVCWEEFNQAAIKDLHFSLFKNEVNLRVIKIQRLNDFLNDLTPSYRNNEWRTPPSPMVKLSKYLALFPLSIACSIRTKSNTDTFKPEYIIPQLLLQYIITEKEVAGIMFPSTKVEYGKIKKVPAYNYIFPVKNVQSSGFCSELIQSFSLTEPTSTELENLTNFGGGIALSVEEWDEMMRSPQSLKFGEGESSPYLTTAFGFLERVLKKRVPTLLSTLPN